MATVEADFDLYSCAQHGSQSTDAYYKVFTPTVETINANGDQAGLNPAVYQRHLKLVIAKDLVKQGLRSDVTQLTDAEKVTLEKKSEKPARERSSAEYLACLFLFLADDNRQATHSPAELSLVGFLNFFLRVVLAAASSDA